jgi:hypothetical protein
MLGVYRVAAQLVASRVVLISTELVIRKPRTGQGRSLACRLSANELQSRASTRGAASGPHSTAFLRQGVSQTGNCSSECTAHCSVLLEKLLVAMLLMRFPALKWKPKCHHCVHNSRDWGIPSVNYISFKFPYPVCVRGPPLWSSGQTSWLLTQRSGFDFRRYQIF